MYGPSACLAWLTHTYVCKFPALRLHFLRYAENPPDVRLKAPFQWHLISWSSKQNRSSHFHFCWTETFLDYQNVLPIFFQYTMASQTDKNFLYKKNKYGEYVVCTGGQAACGLETKVGEETIKCDLCNTWFHSKCQALSADRLQKIRSL